MSRTAWNTILLGSLGTGVLECGLGFSLFFAPGWANGWPGGLSIHTVWSSVMTAFLLLFLMTLAVGVGAAVGSLCAWRGVGTRYGPWLYAAWLVASAAAALTLSCRIYKDIYASTLDMWPGGYPPRHNAGPPQGKVE
jgi:hypothetical protein